MTDYSAWEVWELEVETRTWNCLESAGILTVGLLLRCDERRLLRIKGFGVKSLDDVKNALARKGLQLKEGTS